MWKGESFFSFFLLIFLQILFFFFLLFTKIKFKKRKKRKRKQRHIWVWKWDKWEYETKTCCICDSLNRKFIFYVYPSFCETKSWRNRVLKLICISFNLALVQGCDAFVLLGLLKELIPINSLFLRVSAEVFNLSFPFSFLSLSL